MKSISAVLIVKNEKKRLDDCLKSLDWVDEIVVVDSGSQDGTMEIARKYTGQVFQRVFDNFANQKNYGIHQAQGEWVLCLDADERVCPRLRESLREAAQKGGSYAGYWVELVNYIFGRRFRYGGHGGEKILRFFRKDRGKFIQPVHEKIVVDGPVGKLPGELLHYSTPSLAEYLRKLSDYTAMEAEWLHERGRQSRMIDLTLRPFAGFIRSYFLKLGFLDGYEGFLYHVLSSFYCFLKFARLRELEARGLQGA